MHASTVVKISIRAWALGLTGVYALFILGCSTAAPMAVRYSEKDMRYKAEGLVSNSVGQIYENALKAAEQRKDKNFKIVRTDQANHRIEVTDGIRTGIFMAEGLDAQNSWITIMVDVPEIKGLKDMEKKPQEENRDLALQILSNLCKAIKVECTLFKKLDLDKPNYGRVPR